VLELDERALGEVGQVALLHDIGKVGVPDGVLQKRGPLDDDELTVMRTHPAIGERIMASIEGLAHLAPAVRAEHERWDGDGYPDGLAGEAIPLASRICLVCDAYDAMTTDRPYRKALDHRVAVAELLSGAGHQFDPRVVEAMLEVLRAHPACGAAVTEVMAARQG
jgi:HD-GYP domain-containing protein (c-di-GMP phosphodiesterase class II)